MVSIGWQFVHHKLFLHVEGTFFFPPYSRRKISKWEEKVLLQTEIDGVADRGACTHPLKTFTRKEKISESLTLEPPQRHHFKTCRRNFFLLKSGEGKTPWWSVVNVK